MTVRLGPHPSGIAASGKRVARTIERRPAQGVNPPLELVRSTRRRKTATAFPRDGVVVVQLPAGLSSGEEERMISSLVGRVTGAARAKRLGGDDELWERAAELADRYVDGVRPTSITWSNRMRRRYGSCTPVDGTIRISSEVADWPAYARDYILVHELAHLLHADHSPAFKAVVAHYDGYERAQGFIDGLALAAARAGIVTEDAEDAGDHDERDADDVID